MTLPETSQLIRADGTVLRYCLYGRADGDPVIWHSGSPSSRWKWPTLIESMRQSNLRLLAYDRPGYGGSTRRPGRTVADAVDDVCALADAHGWNRFAVFGGSGGGPHALACAALLAGRVTRCAVLSGIKPAEPGTEPRAEPELRSRLAEVAAEIMGRIDDGGPELPTEPGPPARDDPDAMARLRATFVEGMHGWVDDSLAFARPWGFELATIMVPVGIWQGTSDATTSADHADHLLAHIATARGQAYSGGHLPGADVYDEIFEWLYTGRWHEPSRQHFH
jgi:pimeloyl-ACP methyl ester carboxylesterase